MSITRKLAHFFAAILLTAFIIGIILALPPFYPPAWRYPNVAVGVLFTGSFFSLPVVALAGLVIGMPVAYLMNSLRVSGAFKWAAAGAVSGVFYSFLLALILHLLFTSGFPAVMLAWLAFLPGGTAGLYWWCAVARREQREC